MQIMIRSQGLTFDRLLYSFTQELVLCFDVLEVSRLCVSYPRIRYFSQSQLLNQSLYSLLLLLLTERLRQPQCR